MPQQPKPASDFQNITASQSTPSLGSLAISTNPAHANKAITPNFNCFITLLFLILNTIYHCKPFGIALTMTATRHGSNSSIFLHSSSLAPTYPQPPASPYMPLSSSITAPYQSCNPCDYNIHRGLSHTNAPNPPIYP